MSNILNLILVGLCAAVLSGGIAYLLGRNFWTSSYAATDTNGDGGGPRGGVFVILFGALIGVGLFAQLFSLFLSEQAVGVGVIVSMFTSPIVGVILMLRSQSAPKVDDNR